MNPENQLAQRDQIIKMQNERLAEQTETVKALRVPIELLSEQIAGLQETVDEFQRKLPGAAGEKPQEFEKW